jgi:hypothetical protein
MDAPKLRTVSQMPIQLREHLPQGLKPALLAVLIGTAEAVPSHKTISIEFAFPKSAKRI